MQKLIESAPTTPPSPALIDKLRPQKKIVAQLKLQIPQSAADASLENPPSLYLHSPGLNLFSETDGLN